MANFWVIGYSGLFNWGGGVKNWNVRKKWECEKKNGDVRKNGNVRKKWECEKKMGMWEKNGDVRYKGGPGLKKMGI